MNVNLGPVFEAFVADLLKSGLYQSQSEILREALRLLKEREVTKGLRLSGLRREIRRGAAQADRGLWVDGPAVFAKLRERSAKKKRSRK
jgi:antitoxin ParD1/3/4